MGRKKQKDIEKMEKPVFGSGAEPLPEPKDDGLVKCVCTVPCAWRGYHDEGDRVWIERKLMDGDPFFRGHFKLADGVVADAAQDGEDSGEEGDAGEEGTRSQATENNADGAGENADGGTGNADGAGENADGADGQGELGLDD